MMKKEVSAPGDFMEMVQGFRISRIILSGYELDLFSIIAGGAATSAEISHQAGTDGRATDRLLNALVALGLLDKKGSQFSNTAFSTKFLVKGSPAYLAGLRHSLNLWRSWSHLTECVRKGTTVLGDTSIGERDTEWLRAFIAAMHSRSQQAKDVADALDLSSASHILDVGGGSGLFLYEFIRRNREIKGVVFDLPAVIPITEEYIRKEGFTGRVSTLGGNYLKDPFGSGYDMIYLSAVVHINSQEENRSLVKKCAEALVPGGRLIILDHVMNEERTEPGVGAIFAINMLVGTEKGDTYTENEIRSWMEEAGFSGISRIDTTLGNSLLSGIRTK
jgi:SAM-dependent methyltransferase